MRSATRRWLGRWAVAVLAGLTAQVVLVVAGPPLDAGHDPFPISSGIYRIPYADGVEVGVSGDHHTHDPLNRVDLRAGEGEEIVAAASGWIRGIVDHHGESPGAGDGKDINGNDQDDSLEHSCLNNDPMETVVGKCSDYNNYVWIEHPNGEWTKYSHPGTGTVTALGWEEGDWINAGQVLGLEGDVGAAKGSGGNPFPHLHHEVAVPNDPNDDLEWDELGGFINNGTNLVPRVCDIGSIFSWGLYDDDSDDADGEPVDEPYTAAPCDNQPPTADAGGPYVVDEGSAVQLDGTGSNDPDGNPLTYGWFPETNIDDPAVAQPFYTGADDGIFLLVLNVYDQVEALSAQAFTGVTVNNVAPTVSAVGGTTDEGVAATVTATFTDPGTLDTHTATIDWGDGAGPVDVNAAQLAAGVSHVYGDNGTFDVTVTVTDDDGGVGSDTTTVTVGNVDPTLSLDTSGAVGFPGGDHFVVEPGDELAAAAEGTDPGSDDLTFAWSTGDTTTYFNNGTGPDPFPSPFGTFPFAASDQVDAVFPAPGAETLAVTLGDDDGGTDGAEAGVVVIGTADSTQGQGWWKHQYAGTGSAQVDADTLAGYLATVEAVSGAFSETIPVTTLDEAHDVLSPTGNDERARTTAALLVAWLQFASGAVAWDASVPLADGTSVDFLDLMVTAEEAVLNPVTTDAELLAIRLDLARVRHAG